MKCQRCVLDDSVADLRFNSSGFCNYCEAYLARKPLILRPESERANLIHKINSVSSKYNCIVGVSGGLDSSYLLYAVVKAGLRPLAVHVDTGWNTEVSSRNIENLTRQFGIDLKTYVVDWPQFSQMQLAYLRSGVIDLEFPTDHYYLSALYRVAARHNIKYLLTGNNYASEGIMPANWIHNKGDTTNMLDIFKKFGEGSINRLPTMHLLKKFYYYNVRRIRLIFYLNYLDYKREMAKQTLLKETSWKEYPVKHGESVFTRFYQRYILPRRFGVDYRKAHLSALICNGQITRSEALKELESEILDEKMITEDRNFVLKKLGINEHTFENMMSQPVRQHNSFRSEIGIKSLYNRLSQLPLCSKFLLVSNRH